MPGVSNNSGGAPTTGMVNTGGQIGDQMPSWLQGALSAFFPQGGAGGAGTGMAAPSTTPAAATLSQPDKAPGGPALAASQPDVAIGRQPPGAAFDPSATHIGDAATPGFGYPGTGGMPPPGSSFIPQWNQRGLVAPQSSSFGPSLGLFGG